MRKMLIASITAVPLALGLGGCQSTVGSINKTLAAVSGNDLTAACGIIAVAETYFANVKPKLTANSLSAGQQAQKAAAIICANPPSNITQALVDLNTYWATIQAATTIPGT